MHQRVLNIVVISYQSKLLQTNYGLSNNSNCSINTATIIISNNNNCLLVATQQQVGSFISISNKSSTALNNQQLMSVNHNLLSSSETDIFSEMNQILLHLNNSPSIVRFSFNNQSADVFMSIFMITRFIMTYLLVACTECYKSLIFNFIVNIYKFTFVVLTY